METKTKPDAKKKVENVRPVARDEMDEATFHSMMEESLSQAKAGQGRPL